MATIPSRPTDAAVALRALLRAGALPRLGLVDVGGGSRLSFELAVRATLTDLDHVMARAQGDPTVEADRLQQLCEDLDRLHRMAVAARGSGFRA